MKEIYFKNLKISQQVKVRSHLVDYEYYDQIFFNKNRMGNMSGKFGRIRRFFLSGEGTNTVEFYECPGYFFSKGMLEDPFKFGK